MSSAPESELTRKQRREQARSERKAQEEAERQSAARRKRLLQLGGVAGIAVVILVIVIAVSSGGSSNKAATKQAGEAVAGQNAATALLGGIPQSGITLGSPKAPVTIVEFADLQCPFCQQYTTNVLPTLIQNYVKTGKVQMVWRNLHFIGPDSMRAAQMAAAAGQQNKLWTFTQIFYANQQTENSGYATDGFLTNIAKGAGLDVPKALSDRFAPAAAAQISQADTLAAQSGVSSTPSFLIGKTGGKLQALKYAALTPGSFTPAIDQALKA